MDQKRRTLTFAVVALVSIGIAGVTHWTTRPRVHEEYELVGQEFFPKFQDPNEARFLRVATFNADIATFKEFTVEFKDGLWRIPSHHDYPADAEDRLAETAASVIGIKRGALASRWPSEYAQYGVVDPLSEDATARSGRGQRITLRKQDGSVLADYIIGKEARDFGDGFYYVRNPAEEETYIAELKINLSTDFGDWIEADLLKLERDDLVKIVIDKYSIDEVKRQIVGDEKSQLTRTTWSDPWKLEGLDEQTEEVNTDNVRDLVNDLDNLKIVGVRPKPPGLKPDLSIDTEAIQQQIQLDALIADMMSKGFFVTRDQKLVSNEGEVSAATNDGVVYSLHFGEIFAGTEFEIEVGFANKDGEQKNAESGSGDESSDEQGQMEAAADGSPGDKPAETTPEDDKKSDLKRSRYLFVSARFDPKLIEEPQQPVEPEKPAGLSDEESGQDTEPDAADSGGGSDSEDDSAGSDGDQQEPADDTAASSDTTAQDEPDAADDEAPTESDGTSNEENKDEQEKVDPAAEYKQALEQYQKDLEKYENDRSEYDEKIKTGHEKVDELNDRFGAWYYVITAESFEKLRLSRADLVKPKTADETEANDGDNSPPGTPNGSDETGE